MMDSAMEDSTMLANKVMGSNWSDVMMGWNTRFYEENLPPMESSVVEKVDEFEYVPGEDLVELKTMRPNVEKYLRKQFPNPLDLDYDLDPRKYLHLYPGPPKRDSAKPEPAPSKVSKPSKQRPSKDLRNQFQRPMDLDYGHDPLNYPLKQTATSSKASKPSKLPKPRPSKDPGSVGPKDPRQSRKSKDPGSIAPKDPRLVVKIKVKPEFEPCQPEPLSSTPRSSTDRQIEKSAFDERMSAYLQTAANQKQWQICPTKKPLAVTMKKSEPLDRKKLRLEMKRKELRRIFSKKGVSGERRDSVERRI